MRVVRAAEESGVHVRGRRFAGAGYWSKHSHTYFWMATDHWGVERLFGGRLGCLKVEPMNQLLDQRQKLPECWLV